MRGFLAILIAIIALVWVGCEPTGGAVNAEDKEPHFLEGRRQMQQRDFEGAERSFHKALEANPRSSLAHYEIGLLYFTRKSDPAAAIYHLQRYLSLKPNAPKGTKVLLEVGDMLVSFSFGRAVMLDLAAARFTDVKKDERVGCIRVDANRHNCSLLVFNNGHGVVIGQSSKRVAEMAVRHWAAQLDEEGALA